MPGLLLRADLPPAPGHLWSSYSPPGPLLRADCHPLWVISGARTLRPGHCSGLIATRSGSSPELILSAQATAPGRSLPAPGHLWSSYSPPGPLLWADCHPLQVISGARTLRPGHCSRPIAAHSGSSPELVLSARATAPGKLPPAPDHLRSLYSLPGPPLWAVCHPLLVIPRACTLRPGLLLRAVCCPLWVISGARTLRPGHCSGQVATRSWSSPEHVLSARAIAPGSLPPALGHLRSSYSQSGLLLQAGCSPLRVIS